MAIGTFLDLPQKFGTALKPTTGGGSGPSTRLVPDFNGVSQCALLDAISAVPGDILTLDIVSPTSSTGSFRFILSNLDPFKTIIRVNADDSITVDDGSATLDGLPISTLPLDGQKHTIVWTCNRAVDIELIAAQTQAVDDYIRFANFPIFNIKFNDGSVHSYPMDDGWPNNPVMRNTGSGQDGTFINATEAMWKLIND